MSEPATENLPAAPAPVVAPAPAPTMVPLSVEALLDPIAHGVTPDQLYGLSKSLANSDIVPKDLQGKPYNVFAVILRGLELGITPMTAVCEINLIRGKTVLSAHLQHARVLASGKAKEFRIVETSDDRAVIRVQRHEWPEARDIEFTLAEARKLGLVSGGSAYEKQPANMLRRRVTTRAARECFPDVIIAYDHGELDGDDVAPATSTWSAPPPVTAAPPPPAPTPEVAARQQAVRERAAATAPTTPTAAPSVSAASPPPPPPEDNPRTEPPPVDKTMAPSTLEDDLRDPDEELVVAIMADIANAQDAAALKAAGHRAKPLKERGDKGDQQAAAHYTDIKRAYNARSKELPK